MMPGLSKGILHPTHLCSCQELSLYKKQAIVSLFIYLLAAARENHQVVHIFLTNLYKTPLYMFECRLLILSIIVLP